MIGTAKWVRVLLLIAGGIPVSGMSDTSHPVVIELFTSQGCSSCPPADKLLGEFSQQPGVIALAYHVDYWDDLGWKDHFALPVSVQRQRSYVKRLSESGAFTPQSVVNGASSFVGSNRRGISGAIAQQRASVSPSLSILGDELRIALPEHAGQKPVDVNVVAYLAEASTPIGRGENARRTLREFNIVRSFKRIGSWKGAAGALSVPLASLPADATHAAVLLQQPGQGSIAGAATVMIR